MTLKKKMIISRKARFLPATHITKEIAEKIKLILESRIVCYVTKTLQMTQVASMDHRHHPRTFPLVITGRVS